MKVMKKIKKATFPLRKMLCSFTAILLLLGILGESYFPVTEPEDDSQQVELYRTTDGPKNPNPIGDETGRD